MTEVTPATATIWAKSPNATGDFLPLYRHMDDSADVAAWLWDEWLPRGVAERAAEASSLSVERLRAVSIFLAGVHDIGKATPVFASMHDHLAFLMGAQGLVSDAQRVRSWRKQAHHSRTGAWILLRWLEAQRGVSRPVSRSLAGVVGGHHGAPPTDSELGDIDPDQHPWLFGTGQWVDARDELLQRQWERSAVTPRDLQEPLAQVAQATITGLVIVADWIASNESLFPFDEPLEGRVGQAVESLGLPRPWSPRGWQQLAEAELVAARFDLPEGARVRPVQSAMVRIARQIPAPGLLVVEAPMGEGKTEAALAAAEVLAGRFGRGGIFFALPTQATTDAMFSRILRWSAHLPKDELTVGSSVTLAHGKAMMNSVYQGLRTHRGEVDTESARGEGEGRGRVVVHEWLSGRKKGTLANVVVGTVDQILFAALKSKHLALRMLGLYGKVVVIDEVHAYDAWMNAYLDTVLAWLGEAGVPTILLSATLPPARREELVRAYAPDVQEVRRTGGYPTITSVTAESCQVEALEPSGRGHRVEVAEVPGGLGAIADLAIDLTENGGCLLVVANTVRRAQALYEVLRERRGADEVTLTHSRFLAAHRADRDAELVRQFGPPQEDVTRPERHIVVGTQVVEQSLDVDFDALISDIAPMDLLLQRVGRVHRHERLRPMGLQVPRLWVADIAEEDGAPVFESAGRIYEESLLLATLAGLRSSAGRGMAIPEDIPGLVASTYSEEPVTPEQWRGVLVKAQTKDRAAARRRKQAAKTFVIKRPRGGAIQGWALGEVGDPEVSDRAKAAVRDIEETLEVMVVASQNGRWEVPRSVAPEGLAVSQEEVPPWTVIERLNTCTVRLPQGRLWNSAELERQLWAETPGAWELAVGLSGVPVLVLFAEKYPLARTFTLCNGESVRFSYDPRRGLTVERVTDDD